MGKMRDKPQHVQKTKIKTSQGHAPQVYSEGGNPVRPITFFWRSGKIRIAMVGRSDRILASKKKKEH